MKGSNYFLGGLGEVNLAGTNELPRVSFRMTLTG